ncbi:hypothetical protein [Mesorhizobium sp. dw_380]|uniref:hypothetical protein n=1 Tax=Mesorhizobium sp. dw_380 TaxID=2812001 RepID=UPI001BDE19D1|nr:hypothetical protein [Mesorhizobium sp. dw_380]
MDAPLVAPGKPADLKFSRAVFRLGAPAAATLLIVAYAIAVSLVVVPSNVDVSWLLTVGERVLNGERLYADIAEGNPPFSTWLYLPFLVMERLTGLAAEIWVSVGLAALAVASVCCSARILARRDEKTLKQYVWIIPAAVFVVLFLFPPDFGQREQIAVIALLPWLALLAARDRAADFRAGSVTERIGAGVGAGVFVMIKPPYSVLALAVPAMVIALQRRSLHPLLTTENVVGGTLTIVYLIALAFFMQPFFTDVLPLLRQVYLPMRLPVLGMLMLWPVTMFGFHGSGHAGHGLSRSSSLRCENIASGRSGLRPRLRHHGQGLDLSGAAVPDVQRPGVHASIHPAAAAAKPSDTGQGRHGARHAFGGNACRATANISLRRASQRS